MADQERTSLKISGLFPIVTNYSSIMNVNNSVLDREHEEILEQLEEAAGKGTEAAKIFSEMFARFRHHLGEENETIVPLLSYIKERANGKIIETDGVFSQAEDKFTINYDIMIKEHRIMQDLISRAKEQLNANPDEQSANLANALLHHIALEEEFLYPAAKAAGEIIRLQEKAR